MAVEDNGERCVNSTDADMKDMWFVFDALLYIVVLAKLYAFQISVSSYLRL